MKHSLLVVIAMSLLTVPAFAQRKSVGSAASSTPSSYSYAPSEFSNNAGTMHAYGNLGWFGTENAYLWKDATTNGSVPSAPVTGLLALGGDFEYMLANDLGAGALMRYYSGGETVGTNTEVSFSSFAIGAFTRFHLPHRQLDFYMSPGFGITSSTAKVTASGTSTTKETGTVFTFFIQTGAMYAFTNDMAAGFETTKYMPWSSEVNGWLLQDFVVKFRYSL